MIKSVDKEVASMNTRRVFWTLVHNDARLGFHFRYLKKSEWKYVGLFVIFLGMGVYLFTPVAEVLNIILTLISNIFNFVLLMGIPYLLTKQVINHEWQNGTVAWWLALPYSRRFLLASKCTVLFFRFLKIILVAVSIILFLTLITSTLQPGASNARALYDLPQRTFYNSAIGIILSPLSLALSSLITVLDKSRFKRVLPFLPAAIFFPLYFLSNGYPFSHIPGSTLVLNFLFFPAWSSSLLIAFGFSIGLGALLFFCAAYVLERKINL